MNLRGKKEYILRTIHNDLLLYKIHDAASSLLEGMRQHMSLPPFIFLKAKAYDD